MRIEGAIQPGADSDLANSMQAIGRSAGFNTSADPETVKLKLETLRKTSRLSRKPMSGINSWKRGSSTSSAGQLVKQISNMSDRSFAAEDMLSIFSTEASVGASDAGIVQRVQAGASVDSEIEIAVSNDGQHIVIVNNSRDFATSNDGGETFTTGTAPVPPGGSANGDPSIAYGASGAFYFAYIGFPAAGQCSTGITRSDNNGGMFNFVANATLCDDAVAGGACFPDQEHIAADRFNLSATNQDQVYSTWRDFNGGGCGGSGIATASPEIPTIECSTDSGQTWTASKTPVGTQNQTYPRITVGQDGFVYVVYRAGNTIMLNKFSSCDTGLTQQALYPRMIVGGISRVTCPAVPGLDRCNSGSDLSSHTVAVDDTDPSHVYAAYSVSTMANVNENVLVQDSLDGGFTWPAARTVQLNTNVNGRRFMPWVCAADGTDHVSWYDMRAASAVQNDLTDYFAGSAFLNGVGNLVAGQEFKVSTVSDRLCCAGDANCNTIAPASGWPSAPRNANDSESCSTQPQLAGACTDGAGAPTGTRCDFSNCGGAGMGVGAACDCAAGNTCNTGRGVPKYGDYSGNACSASRFYTAWASATSPPDIVPASTDIDTFFDFKRLKACDCDDPAAIVGTAGTDNLVGTPGADIICGLGGDDRLVGLGGPDCIDGGEGNDFITGIGGNDLLLGGRGDDNITGGDGADEILGEEGDDNLTGGNGNDTIDGLFGFDIITGGAGADICNNGDLVAGCP